MGTVAYDQIGTWNKSLVSAIKAGNTLFEGPYRVADWKHANPCNYDLSYGVTAFGSKNLPGKTIGVKYYGVDKVTGGLDGKIRFVHIYDPDNKVKTQKFYRLIHTSAAPGLSDNSYSQCDEITGIP